MPPANAGRRSRAADPAAISFDNRTPVRYTGGVASPLPTVTSLSQLVPARDRAIEVDPALSPLLPDGGVRRGHVVSCGGVAARSLALALAARPVEAGAWLAVVGLPDLGVEAAVEHGVAPERVVSIAAGSPAEWAERLAAAADGFEILLTAPPPGAERQMRKLRQRLTARGNVLLVVRSGWAGGRPAAPISSDVDLTTTGATWVGIGQGHGRLMARRVTISSAGRRVPRPVIVQCWLPGPDGRADVVQTGTGAPVVPLSRAG